VSESARPRLQRSHDRWLAGVCSGLADYFNIDPLIVRIAFVAAAFLQGWGIVLYLVLWFLMPSGDAPPAPIGDFRSHFRAMNDDLRHLGMNFAGGRATPAPTTGVPAPDVTPPPPPGSSPQRTRGGIVVGVVLIALGAWFLLQNLGLFEWWRWDLFWPVVIILLGLALLVRRFR